MSLRRARTHTRTVNDGSPAHHTIPYVLYNIAYIRDKLFVCTSDIHTTHHTRDMTSSLTRFRGEPRRTTRTSTQPSCITM